MGIYQYIASKTNRQNFHHYQKSTRNQPIEEAFYQSADYFLHTCTVWDFSRSLAKVWIVPRGCVISVCALRRRRRARRAGVPIIALQSPSGLMLTNVLWTCMAAADENDGRFVIVKMDVEGDQRIFQLD